MGLRPSLTAPAPRALQHTGRGEETAPPVRRTKKHLWVHTSRNERGPYSTPIGRPFCAPIDNRVQAEASAALADNKRTYEAVERKLSGLIDAIADGLRAPGLQQKLDELEARKASLQAQLVSAPAPAPRLHPNLAEVYRQKVSALENALHAPGDGTAALEAIRALVERVILHPATTGQGLEIELVGEIAAMIRLAQTAENGHTAASGSDLFARSVKVVAGRRNHRELEPIMVLCQAD